MRIGGKFLENYWHQGMETILEIGSYDVNGSLRTMKPAGSKWVGVDIEDGPGVDKVVNIGQQLPFEDSSFDLIVATSVFEHDPSFWKTLADMARLVKDTGHIFITAPSNGMVHRFPLDCFRFYPDASVSFLNIISDIRPGTRLEESFIGEQDHEGLWNDFVAIFSMASAKQPKQLISTTEKITNLWSSGTFQEETLVEFPEDRRNADSRLAEIASLEAENAMLRDEIRQIHQSKSWRITAPLRGLSRN